jgi:hypothetical protein
MHISAFFADIDLSTNGLVVVLAIVAAIVIFSAFLSKKRREALQRVATQLGYTFEKDGDNFDEALSSHLHIFKLGPVDESATKQTIATETSCLPYWPAAAQT